VATGRALERGGNGLAAWSGNRIWAVLSVGGWLVRTVKRAKRRLVVKSGATVGHDVWRLATEQTHGRKNLGLIMHSDRGDPQ